MKNFHNIESVKRNNSYTGYDATGRSWRIFGSTGCWSARANVPVKGLVGQFYGADTLAYMSRLLESVGE